MGHVKQFRIEKMMGLEAPVTQGVSPEAAGVPAEPAPVVSLIANGSANAPAVAGAPDLTLEELAALRDRVSEAARLQVELAELSGAIEKTKRELSALHYDGPVAGRFQEAGNELDAVVNATESATETILSASEKIDSAAAHLRVAAHDDVSRAQADDISEQVVTIFEACNFQDITGQRISKVVAALQFIDERVARMMEIWGGAQDLAAFSQPAEEPDDEDALLNGPALEDQHGHATQDDIDALFA